MEDKISNLEKMKKTITVIGAGVGGLYTALKLSELGFSVTVLERQNIVGGLGASLLVQDYKIDIGPHYMTFRKNSEITKEIFELLDTENIIEIENIEKSYLSYYNQRILNRFPTISDAIFSSGIKSILASSIDLIRRRYSVLDKENSSSEEYLRACFGNFFSVNYIF